MTLSKTKKNLIYDFLEVNKISISNSKGINKIVKLIYDEFNIDLSYFETKYNIIEFLTEHWDKKCKIEGCSNKRKQLGILPNRIKYNNYSTSYGIYKYCSDECNYKSIKIRQSGENNTCHRMSEESKESMKSKNSMIMKDKIKMENLYQM